MTRLTPTQRRSFVFLQGPHGPFFASLARRLAAMGHDVARVAFNAGDALFWRGLPGLAAYHETPGAWRDRIETHLRATGATDLVCYGASRPIHAAARDAAAALGLRVHVFEEGYLRPYWVTYERGGTNADSPLMNLSIARMRAALDGEAAPLRHAPDRWGDMRSHVFWGAAYHAALLAGARRFEGYAPHRTPGPKAELGIYARHLATLPLRRIRRRIATAQVLRQAAPYHVVLLQLTHDANFRDNGPFPSQEAFLDTVFRGFASGAPAHHRLVLKAHPFEDGREPLPPLVRSLARTHGVGDRVHLVTGGKLARLLDEAESAVTVNSTAAEQALWRGLPVKAFGRAVYHRPELTSDQPLPAFFAAPHPPDTEAYATYRRFLLASSQIPGGYYSAQGRRRLIRRLPDLMLARQSPTEALLAPAAAEQHMAVVR